MHPRHKLKYFEKAGWESSWIAAAEEIVRAEFDRSYATLPNTNHDIPDSEPPPKKAKVSSIYSAACFLHLTATKGSEHI